MVWADGYVRVEFDEEGEKRIKETIETLQEVIDAVSKITSLGYMDDLREAKKVLQGILDGELI